MSFADKGAKMHDVESITRSTLRDIHSLDIDRELRLECLGRLAAHYELKAVGLRGAERQRLIERSGEFRARQIALLMGVESAGRLEQLVIDLVAAEEEDARVEPVRASWLRHAWAWLRGETA